MQLEEKENIYKEVYNRVKELDCIDKNSVGFPQKKKNLDFFFTMNRCKCTWSLNVKADRCKISCEVPGGEHSREELQSEGARQKAAHPKIFYTCFGNQSITYNTSCIMNSNTTLDDLWNMTLEFIEFMKTATEFVKAKNLVEQQEQSASIAAPEKEPETSVREEPSTSMESEEETLTFGEKPWDEPEPQHTSTMNFHKSFDSVNKKRKKKQAVESPKQPVAEDLEDEIKALFGDLEENTSEKTFSSVPVEEYEKIPENFSEAELTVREKAIDEEYQGIYSELLNAFEARKVHLDKKENMLLEQEKGIKKAQKEVAQEKESLEQKTMMLQYKEKDLEQQKTELSGQQNEFEKQKAQISKRSLELTSAEQAVKNREKAISAKELNIKNRETEVDKLNSILQNREKELSNREQDVTERERQVKELETQLELRSDILKTQQTNLQYSLDELKEKEKELENKEADMVSAKVQEELEAMKTELTLKNDTIQTYQTKIDACKQKMLDFNQRYKELVAQKERLEQNQNSSDAIQKLQTQLEYITNEKNKLEQEASRTMETSQTTIEELKATIKELENRGKEGSWEKDLSDARQQIKEKESRISQLEEQLQNTSNEAMEMALKEKDSKITELNNRVVELECQSDDNRMVLSIKEQLQSKDIPCEVIPSEGPIVLKVVRDGCDIYINEVEKIIIAEKPTKNANKYKNAVARLNQEDTHGFYSIVQKKIMVKRFLVDAVADVLSVAENLRELN